MITKNELALCFGLSATICVTFVFGLAILYNTNQVIINFPFNEHYLEFVLGVFSSLLIGHSLFTGGD